MFDDAALLLRRSRDSFEDNVRDPQGEMLLQEMFQPLERATHNLQEADAQADREIRSIKMLLRELRMIK